MLLIILYHFKSQKKLDNTSTRIFYFFIITALADVGFDIGCTLLIMAQKPELATITKASLTIFYLLQLTLPIALIFYAQTLRGVPLVKIQKEMALWLKKIWT